MTPADIDFVAAHATGTPDNDSGEYAALARVFGDDLPRVPVVGFKSHLGHTLGGAGAVELILSAMALRDQVVPPCATIKPEDVEYPDLRVATGAETPAGIRATLNTSLGFGGANTCVVLGPPLKQASSQQLNVRSISSDQRDEGAQSSTFRGRDVFITGVGVVFPGAVGNDAFLARISDESPTRVTDDTGPLADEAFIHLLNARRVRRMSEYVKLSLAATAVAFGDAGIADIPAFSATCSGVLGSTHGSANYSKDYYKQIVDEGIPAANPMLFAEGVPNAAAAHLSLMMQIKGACQTIIGTRTAGLDALRLAAMRIAAGTWDRAVVSAGEEFSPIVNAAYKHCGLYSGTNAAFPFTRGDGFASSCGAVTFILESGDSLRARAGGRARGVVRGGASAAPDERGEAAAASRVLESLGDPRFVLSSANGTWIDRVEAVGLRRSADRTGRAAVVSSVYGHVGETFSANPLGGIAAVLLGGRLPRLFGPGAGAAEENNGDGVRSPDNERVDEFAALCTDYTGLSAGVRVGVMGA